MNTTKLGRIKLAIPPSFANKGVGPFGDLFNPAPKKLKKSVAKEQGDNHACGGGAPK